MKKAMLILSILLSESLFSASTCSLKGTQLIYTNGILTQEHHADEALELIKKTGILNQLDEHPMGIKPILAYNFRQNIFLDLVEATIQKLPSAFLLAHGTDDPYQVYLSINGSNSLLFKESYPDEFLQFSKRGWLLNLNTI